MSLPLAIIAMVLILAGFALYVMLAARLYKRLRTAVQQRGLQESRRADWRECGGVHLAIRLHLAPGANRG
jgi:hypothetical protein